MTMNILKEAPREAKLYSTRKIARSVNANIVAAWVFWFILSSLILLCILPRVFGTSLWMSHIDLYFKPSSELEWTRTVDEGLELFSLFTNDLAGTKQSRSRSKFASISTNIYTFDFASWCRKNSNQKSVVCYRGDGMNIVSAFVTDFGSQVADIGNLEDPRLFGQSLAQTYRDIVNDLDRIFHQPKGNKGTLDLDMDKLKIVHRLHVFENMGRTLMTLRIVHILLMCIVSLTVWTREILAVNNAPVFFKYNIFMCWTIYVVLNSCTLLSFCFFSSETVLITRLNAELTNHGVRLVQGPGNILLLVETFASLIFSLVVVFSD